MLYSRWLQIFMSNVQVDAGLRFENRKQKYQYMFNVKTPKRIYYLVAENEADMNKWVDAVCQVCGLKAYTQDEEQQSKNICIYNLNLLFLFLLITHMNQTCFFQYFNMSRKNLHQLHPLARFPVHTFLLASAFPGVDLTTPVP